LLGVKSLLDSCWSGQIPTLQANLAAAQAELVAYQAEASPDADLIEAAQTKIEKVEEAITGWQSIINYTDKTLAQAEAGDLVALTQLMPHELMAAAKNLDRSDAPGAAAKMELYDAISFTGGGHAVSSEASTAVLLLHLCLLV
jgi:capsule polysaccharide export protein KpsE/RkpR